MWVNDNDGCTRSFFGDLSSDGCDPRVHWAVWRAGVDAESLVGCTFKHLLVEELLEVLVRVVDQHLCGGGVTVR